MATRNRIRPRLDFHDFIPAQPSVITEASWIERDRLAARHYPHIMDLLTFGPEHLISILIDVECDTKPPAEFPVGCPGTPFPPGCRAALTLSGICSEESHQMRAVRRSRHG